MSDATPKERPAIFTGESVRAIVAGTKTQTRRVVNFSSVLSLPRVAYQHAWPHPGGGWVFSDCPRAADWEPASPAGFPCPYGRPGDRIWVKETFFTAEAYSHGTTAGGREITYTGVPRGAPVHYAADGDPANTPNRHYPNGLREGCGKFAAPDPHAIWVKRSSLHMPRWASRITLEVKAVRVERLSAVDEWAAYAEGIPKSKTSDPNPVASYRSLWDLINGKKHPWASDPWVWVVAFRRLEPST